MATRDSNNLLCLDGSDPAAIALAMQDIALTTEAALSSRLTAFNTFLTAPTAIGILNVTATGFPDGVSGGQTVGSTAGSWGYLYSNFTPPVHPLGYSLTTTGYMLFPSLPVTTWYHVGAYIKPVASGAVTLNSVRSLSLQAFSQYLTPFPYGAWYADAQESNTGGEHLTVEGTVAVPPNSYMTLASVFYHTNTGSTCNVLSGSLMWMTKLGTSDQIRTT